MAPCFLAGESISGMHFTRMAKRKRAIRHIADCARFWLALFRNRNNRSADLHLAMGFDPGPAKRAAVRLASRFAVPPRTAVL